VALPAIAADQTTQKVSASTVTADSEEYVCGPLDVFGNANGDDIIDMRDTTYIKLVIFGKKSKTKLADANNDGKVSMLDVGQTKLIILGKEKKLTFVDVFGEAVTVNKPIKRLVNLGYFSVVITRIIGARDILVAVGYDRSNMPNFYPEISKLPALGYTPDSCDFEYVLSLKPDAVVTNLEYQSVIKGGGLEQKRMFEEKLPGIPIISLNVREQDVLLENMRTYGYILDREDEAEEFIDWFEGHLNTYKALTEELSEEERPRVYLEMRSWGTSHGTYKGYKAACPGYRHDQALVSAGGRNILDACPYGKGAIYVDPEWVIEQNPEFIIKWGVPSWVIETDYETDDPSAYVATRQELLNRPELANVDAVKNERVYVLATSLWSGAGNTVIGIAYIGKLLQPDLFKDVDPQAIHQEYVDKFCYINFDVKERGAFMWSPYEEW
jgi:iron complex transport system substrate-binding protein